MISVSSFNSTMLLKIRCFGFWKKWRTEKKNWPTLYQTSVTTNSNPTHSAPYLLALIKQQWEISLPGNWIVKLVLVQTTSGKCHASVASSFSETKGFFCLSLNKRSSIFCVHCFSKMKCKSTKTVKGRCFFTSNQSVCQNWAWSCKKLNQPKKWYVHVYPFCMKALYYGVAGLDSNIAKVKISTCHCPCVLFGTPDSSFINLLVSYSTKPVETICTCKFLGWYVHGVLSWTHNP